MKRRQILRTILSAAAGGALVLTGCSTTQTRITEHPEIYQRLGANDQALVARGQIRDGLAQGGVFLAWGQPDQRSTANVHGRPAETWIYLDTTGDISPYPHYGLGYGGFGGGFGGGGFGGGGFGGGFGGGRFGGGRFYSHHGHRFYGFGYDPFYDPFFFSRFETIQYPSRTVSFQNGRVVAYQFLYPPRIY